MTNYNVIFFFYNGQCQDIKIAQTVIRNVRRLLKYYFKHTNDTRSTINDAINIMIHNTTQIHKYEPNNKHHDIL